MPPIVITNSAVPIIEFMFSLVAIAACFIVYFKTKEIYELSEHKGIKYFRNAFLFFGITYLANFIMRILAPHIRRIPFDEAIPFLPKIIMTIGAYASTATFIYLLLTVLWKKLDKTFISSPYVIHGISLLVALVTVFERMPFTFFFFQLVFFLMFIFILILNKSLFGRKQNKIILITYILIFGHWIILMFFDIFAFVFPVIGSIIYLITLSFFIILLDRFWMYFSQSNKIREIKNEKKRKTRSNKRYT